MRPSLVAVLVLSLVGLSGAAMSDGMPAKKHSYAKAKPAKAIKKHHSQGPHCPSDCDDSWAIAEQLNHEEWLRHRQDDLQRRGGGGGDLSGYDDRYERDYAARDQDFEAWGGGEADDADLLREAGAEGFRRDHGYQGHARRYVDKRVYKRYSSEGRGYGWEDGGHGWGGQAERRVYRSHGGRAWGDHARSGGYAEKRVYRSQGGYGHGEIYAGGSRDFDEDAGGYHGRYAEERAYGGGHRASRYGYADDYAYGHGGGYASSGYGSHGYGEGHGGRWSGGGRRFHYDAGYAGRDELGYLTWPGKAG